MTLSTISSAEKRNAGGEQARALRALVERQSAANVDREPAENGCHTIAVAGGKGGVGRSIIALNLAITLAQRGETVGLIDASSDIGNIELLCGLGGYWNLSHVVQGSRQLSDIVNDGPAGVRILSGASCLQGLTIDSAPTCSRIHNQLNDFERTLKWLIIDASSGTSSTMHEFAAAADDLLIVTTPESTAITEAYATVKSFSRGIGPRLGLLVNQADSIEQAQRILDRLQQTAHTLLQTDLHRRGSIPRDSSVPMSVNSRTPFVLQAPTSPAAFALQKLAQRWTRPHALTKTCGYFSRLSDPLKKGTASKQEDYRLS